MSLSGLRPARSTHRRRPEDGDHRLRSLRVGRLEVGPSITCSSRSAASASIRCSNGCAATSSRARCRRRVAAPLSIAFAVRPHARRHRADRRAHRLPAHPGRGGRCVEVGLKREPSAPYEPRRAGPRLDRSGPSLARVDLEAVSLRPFDERRFLIKLRDGKKIVASRAASELLRRLRPLAALLPPFNPSGGSLGDAPGPFVEPTLRRVPSARESSDRSKRIEEDESCARLGIPFHHGRLSAAAGSCSPSARPPGRASFNQGLPPAMRSAVSRDRQTQVDVADYRADLEELARLREEVAPLAGDPPRGYLAHSWAGFASWRIAINDRTI